MLVLPLSALTIVLAEHKQDWLSGVLLALACCLKPQIGIWLGIYYLARGRLKIVSSSLGVAVVVAALFFLHPVPYQSLLASYGANLQHWFAPGGFYGFTEGSMSFILLRTQSLFYRITHNVPASSWMAYMLFLCCAALWGIFMWRSGKWVPSSLAVTTLIALSFLSFYHSIPDVALLVLALVDAFPYSSRRWTRIQRWVCFLLFLLMLPQRSIFGVSHSPPQRIHYQILVVGPVFHSLHGLASAGSESHFDSADAGSRAGKSGIIECSVRSVHKSDQ